LNIIDKNSDNTHIEKFITNLFVQYQKVHLLVGWFLSRKHGAKMYENNFRFIPKSKHTFRYTL